MQSCLEKVGIRHRNVKTKPISQNSKKQELKNKLSLLEDEYRKKNLSYQDARNDNDEQNANFLLEELNNMKIEIEKIKEELK